MWRSRNLKKGKQILTLVHRHLATEAGGASNVPPPPPPKSRGFGLVKFFGLGLPLATGGIVGYAWYDKDFRKQLEDTVPYAKEALENVLPPEESAPQSNLPKVENSQERFPAPIFEPKTAPVTTSVFPVTIVPSALCSTEEGASNNQKIENNDNDGVETIKSENIHSKKEQKFVVDTKEKNNSNEVKDPTETSGKPIGLAVAQQENEKDVKITVEEQLKMKKEEEKADNAALELVINKLLESAQNWVSEAARAQIDVAKATNNHSNILKKAMDDTSDILHKDSEWEAVTIAYKEREIAVNRANELLDEARKSVEKLKRVLEEAKVNKVTMKNSAIYPASKKLSEFAKDMSAAGAQVRQAEADAKVMFKYKDLVDKGRRQFQMELESVLPDVKPGVKSRKLTDEELNALIAHAHRRIEQLQKQVAEHLAMEQKRLNVALETQREENKIITESAVKDKAVRLNQEFELEKQQLEVEFEAQMEAEVRKQLSRQAAAHSDHLQDILAVQEKQMLTDFERRMNIKMLEEREKFQTETSSWISRLKGIEAAVDARAACEKLARTAQDLWLACIALNSSILFGNEESESLTPLLSQVQAVVNSANKHPFVETIANTIPQTALERGVYTENDLRDRFVRVSQVTRRLGLIQESNASLYKYLISFMHSFFTIDNVSAYSEKDMVALEEMDNFQLVANAQYWMEKGNLELAVRFMCQLTGESKNAANDWITEAKLLLETRQAANTIIAFASATGLAATF